MEPSSDAPVFETYADLYAAGPYAAFEQQHRSGGTFGLQFVDVQQGPIETVDPALPQMVFVVCRGTHTHSLGIDFGDGRRRGEFRPGVIDLQPADQDCYLDLPALHLCATMVHREVMGRLLDEVGLTPSALDFVTGEFRCMPRAAALVERLWSLCQAGGPSTALAIDAAFLDLLALLTAANGDVGLCVPLPVLGDRRLRRVVDYIEAHLDAPLSAGELAGVACVSVLHFGRVFRAAVGETPHRYVMGRRVERAKAMLLGTQLDLAAVALATGFASQSHFTGVFRRRVGLPPGEWRRRAR